MTIVDYYHKTPAPFTPPKNIEFNSLNEKTRSLGIYYEAIYDDSRLLP
ncbi:hypothetical protein IQ215_01565 [Cyanobacterium stanieri LEGE 03274]|uniref:Uncharacterized protein n=1 Tax=Cyanobacterium stanieri LEGE 03274 TaxID=1828756 RepID=A0ABR9V3J3_9CHRO|nr:hypothetical protein [Cyanobacterium stanieri]MBE9221374.1 hypothetical protein [Cyanobacterium stanieri LEGE 03274]